MTGAISLSDHFGYRKLIRFTLPSVAMMVFTSIYGIVDGFFVSNYVGKSSFAAINFIYPLLMVLGAVGFMLGAGGSALVGKTMGEGDDERANRLFSMFIYITIGLGVLLAVFGILFTEKVAVWLGADETMAPLCGSYGRVVLLALPAFMLQMEFQTFCVTAEKPRFGFLVTVAAGCMNMVLDALFVGVLSWGLEGAAAATAISQATGGLVPLCYFAFCKNSRLRIGKAVLDLKAFWKGCTNGVSELLSNIASSVASMLYNWRLMAYAGEDGVAAFGVLMYVNFVFLSVFIGYVVGTAPVVSYHYGAENRSELKSLRQKGMRIIFALSLVMFASAQILARTMSGIFASYDEHLMEMTVHGMRIFSFQFLFAGFAIFASSFFTALNNGFISAAISFLRTLVFEMIFIVVLPRIFGLDGVWLSLVSAEFTAFAVSGLFLIAKRKKYGY